MFAPASQLTNQNLSQYLKKGGILFVKRKSGFLPYIEDPEGLRSIFARAFPKTFQIQTSKEIQNYLQSSKSQFVKGFSGKSNILVFVNECCNDSFVKDSEKTKRFSDFCTSIVYECLSNETPELLFTYLQLIEFSSTSRNLSLELLNFKLIQSFYQNHPLMKDHNTPKILQQNFLTAVESSIENLFEKNMNYSQQLDEYISNPNSKTNRLILGAFLLYKDFPSTLQLKSFYNSTKNENISLQKVIEILNNIGIIKPHSIASTLEYCFLKKVK